MIRLGAVLKTWRRHYEYTLRDVSHQIDITLPTYARVEQGNNVDADTLMKILNWLMEEED